MHVLLQHGGSLALKAPHNCSVMLLCNCSVTPYNCSVTLSVSATRRGRVAFTSKGNVVYAAAGLGVVQSTQEGQEGQMITAFRGHTDGVACLAVDSKGDYVVTGEMGKSSLVCVWGADDGVQQVQVRGVLPVA